MSERDTIHQYERVHTGYACTLQLLFIPMRAEKLLLKESLVPILKYSKTTYSCNIFSIHYSETSQNRSPMGPEK